MRRAKAQAVTVTESQPQHKHEGIQDDPRSRLLWSIVGQATSTTWTIPPPTACSPHVEGICTDAALTGTECKLSLGQSRVPVAAADVLTAPQPAECTAAADNSRWLELPADLLANIAGHTRSASAVLAFAGVCRTWRHALLCNGPVLKQLVFETMSYQLFYPYSASGGSKSSSFPSFVHQAAMLGNCSACVAAATALDRMMLCKDAMRYWLRAARAGNVPGMVHVGEAYYLGSKGMDRDSAEAFRWLSRGAKALCSHANIPLPSAGACLPASSEQIVRSLAKESGPGAKQYAVCGAQQPTAALGPVGTERLDLAQLLKKAGMYLGLLSLDGEASGMDVSASVRWLRLAACAGSMEAADILGTLYATGQYG